MLHIFWIGLGVVDGVLAVVALFGFLFSSITSYPDPDTEAAARRAAEREERWYPRINKIKN